MGRTENESLDRDRSDAVSTPGRLSVILRTRVHPRDDVPLALCPQLA
jgi:hypothetical protein